MIIAGRHHHFVIRLKIPDNDPDPTAPINAAFGIRARSSSEPLFVKSDLEGYIDGRHIVLIGEIQPEDTAGHHGTFEAEAVMRDAEDKIMGGPLGFVTIAETFLGEDDV
jgi:hypothetical protein